MGRCVLPCRARRLGAPSGPVKHRPLQITEYGVYCTTQAQDKPVEAPAPEIEESGSENGLAPFRRSPAPATTTHVPGVRPP